MVQGPPAKMPFTCKGKKLCGCAESVNMSPIFSSIVFEQNTQYANKNSKQVINESEHRL